MQQSKSDLKISIHIVNADIPTNLQNILRAKIDNIIQKLGSVQKERGIKKNLIFINNRELKPLDLVLRMNVYPEVAFLGWRLPSFFAIKKNISASLLRSKMLNDPQLIRYKKAFLGQRLRNSLTVLVGDINEIVSRSAEMGFNPQIYLKNNRAERLENREEIIERARQTSLIPNDYIDQEIIDIDSVEDWEHFIRNYGITQIDRLDVLNMSFKAFIDVQENDNEYVFLEESFNETFFKIWNIEQKYLNLNYISDLQEFSIISASKPLLLVLPREILRMVAIQLGLEGSTIIFSYENIDQALNSVNDFKDVSFSGVLCREDDVARLREFQSCSQACFFAIDGMIDKDLWEKFLRLDFDITDEREFDILTSNLQTALNDLNFSSDPALRDHVPPQLSSYLKNNFKLICDAIKSIITNKEFTNLPNELSALYQQEAELKIEFSKKISHLELAKQKDFTPLKPTIEEIKGAMVKLKDYKHKIDEIYSFNEKIELDAQQRIQEIEKCKSRLKNIAIKQFSLAENLGSFLVTNLRKNREFFENNGRKYQPTTQIIKTERRVFNFDESEWEIFSGCNIYFITRYRNLVRLLHTLLKAEAIPEKAIIKAQLPDEKLKNADWVFYDRSCSHSELNPIQSGGKSFFDSQNFNELLTKTELDKTDLIKTLERFEKLNNSKGQLLSEKEEELYQLNKEHNRLLLKAKKRADHYSNDLQKFRVLNELVNSFLVFYKEVDRKMVGIHRIMKRLELISTQMTNKEESARRQQLRFTKQIIGLTEIITSFYYSLAFLKFATRVLHVLPKLTNSFRWHIAQNELEKSKLKHKLHKPIHNVLLINDNSFAADKISEHLLSMMMLHFRINRDRFHVTDSNRYRNYINPNIDFFAIVLTGDTNQLDSLKYMVQDIVSIVPDALIFALCQYPSSLIAELEIMRDSKTIETLSYIRKYAFLSDAVHIKPDNKLHITSLYLYSLS